MTKDEFKLIVNKLRKAYTQDNYIADKESFDIWFEMLEDLQAPATEQAVKNIIRDKTYPPTIADIRHEYDRLYEVYKAKLRDVRSNYEIGMQGYPCFINDDETYQVFLAKIKQYPQSEWIKRSIRFKNTVIDFVRDCELNDKEIPDYKDYVNEQAV